MTLAEFGFMLLFISNQISLVADSYPPFGIITLFVFRIVVLSIVNRAVLYRSMVISACAITKDN